MDESPLVRTAEEVETVDALRLGVRALEAEREALHALVLRLAGVRMCRDMLTMIELCPPCSLKRQGEYRYSSTHDEKCLVNQAWQLGS